MPLRNPALFFHISHSSLKPCRRKRAFWLILTLPLLGLGIGYQQLQTPVSQPQGILMLGGSSPFLERERFTADLARQHADLPIWISSGGRALGPYEASTRVVFADMGANPDHIYFDYQAQDTLTNFTTLVDELQARGIRSIYLVTSDYHMRRARLIGEIVLGSRGIQFQPVEVPSHHEAPEPLEKTVRDGVRALVWVVTGYTGIQPPSSPR